MRKLLITLIVIMTATPALAGGGGITGGATEWTQLANNAELGAILGREVEQIAQQVEMIRNQINQYQEMLKQGAALPNSVWRSVENDLTSLRKAVQTTSGMYSSLGNLGQVFRQTNPGIETRSSRGLTYEEWYKKQSEAYNNDLEATLKGISISSTQIEQDAAFIKLLQGQNRSAIGQMQALQVGNDIAAETAQQLLKLQEAINRQTILMAATLGKQQGDEDANSAELEEYLQKREVIRQLRLNMLNKSN